MNKQNDELKCGKVELCIEDILELKKKTNVFILKSKP